MARFKLLMNGKEINSLEELKAKDNFDAQQMLAYYKSKALQHWLETHNYIQELEKINAVQIQDENECNLIISLMEALAFDSDLVALTKDKMNVSLTKEADKNKEELENCITDIENDHSDVEIKQTDKNAVSTISFQLQDGHLLSTFSPVACENNVYTPVFNSTGSENPQGLFFYNGFYFAWIRANPNDVHTIIVLHSKDLKTWEQDEQLSNLNFEWDHVFMSGQFCCLVKQSYPPSKSKCIIGSTDGKWKEIDFGFDSEMKSGEYSIIGIVERNNVFGVLCEAKYETTVKLVFREQRYQYLFRTVGGSPNTRWDLGHTDDECPWHYLFFSFSGRCFLGRAKQWTSLYYRTIRLDF